MSQITELTIASLQDLGGPSLEHYTRWLRETMADAPPPHAKAWYGRMYRQLACRREWFANSLAINANQEGFGSRRIWELSRQVEDPEVAELVRGHSMDESRHSRMFFSLLDELFPGALHEPDTRERVRSYSPGYTKRSHPPTDWIPEQALGEVALVHQLIGLNLTEVRALVLQYLLREMLKAYAQPHQQRMVLASSDRLISDEVRHIQYSAYCIERFAAEQPAAVRELMHQRQRSLNEEFLAEVELETF